MARTHAPEQEQQPPPRRGRPAPVGDDARGAAANAFARLGFKNPVLVLRWREIAGAEVARLAQPMKLTGAILTLRAVPGAALFLAHEKRSLCERINAFLGHPAVSQIKFVQGQPTAPLRAMSAAPKPAHALPPADPSHHYQGPEGLAQALRALARRR